MDFDRLLAAAEEGKYALLAKNLSKQPNLVDHADENGWTLLHRAALRGQTRVVELLLSNGADPNKSDKKRWIALHWASTGYVEHLPSMCLLLRAGSQLEARTTELQTPLMVCAEYSNIDGFALLLGRGARLDWKNKRKRDARAILERALEHSHHRKFAQQRADLKVMIAMIDAYRVT